MRIRQALANKQYIAAVVLSKDRTIRQYINGSNPAAVLLFSDPSCQELFKAQMLVNLSEAMLASTPENAGVLSVFLYKVVEQPEVVIPPLFVGLHGFGRDLDILRPMRGGDSFHESPLKELTPIVGGGIKPTLPSPKSEPKEVGDVSVSSGTKGQKLETKAVRVELDTTFAVQRLDVRLLGVREGARDSLIQVLEQV